MVTYIDLKLKCIAGHTEIVIQTEQRIRYAADYDRVIKHIAPAVLHEFSSQLSTIRAMLC